jgi:Ca2+-binding RTX toxin-like protein
MSINSALTLAYDQLSNFAGLENFWNLFDTAFGTQYDYLTAFTLKSQWQSHDFSSFPQIEVVSSDVLGTANGAYAISTNKIYLSDAFISSASQQSLEAVILEEYGHFVDAQVNQTDTPGDEGELFSAIVRSVSLSAAELSRIKTENDHATVTIDGQQVAIEMSTSVVSFEEQSSASVFADTSPFNTNIGIITFSGNGAIVNVAGNWAFTGYSGSNFLGFNDATYATGSETLYFSQVVNNFSIKTGTPSVGTFSISLYDINNNILGSGSYAHLSNFQSYEFSFGVGISKVNFDSTASAWAVDDISITYDDTTAATITLAVAPTSVNEDGTTNLVYTFNRTGPTTSPLTVNYGITGTADATDYTGATHGTGKTITFAANSATATLTIDPTADTLFENNETVALTLATGTGYTVGTTAAVTGTITNDDFPSITLAVAPTSVTEDGTTNLVYTFTRTGPTTSTLTANYGITGTADATDYTGATPGTGKTITFAANSATATLTIDPTADTLFENNETVALTLATGTSYTLGTATAVTGTITNDDLPSITLAVAPSSVTEDGTTNLVYTFTRTGSTTSTLIVNYGITGTADATDYTGATPGTGKTITFAANSATATLTIDPTTDTLFENNETVALTLATGTGYTIGTTNTVIGTITGNLTILDFESPLPAGLSPTSSFAQNTPIPSTATITDQYASLGVKMSGVALLNGGIGHAPSGTNFVGGIGSGSLMDFDAPLTFQFVSPIDGSTPAYINYFAISPDLWGSTGNNVIITGYDLNGTILGVTTYTETGNLPADTPIELQNVGNIYKVVVDPSLEYGGGIAFDLVRFSAPVIQSSITLAVAPANVLEDGTTNLVYTFTRTGATTNALTVNYTIAGTATNGTDYATIGTNVTFAANSATATLTIDPTADTTIESDETVALTLATGTGYTVGTTTTVTGTITNDDLPSITLAVAPTSVTEDGTTNLVYTFTRTGATTSALTVNYSIAGTADATDYTGATPGTGKTITFAANSATATLTIDPTADTTIESNETVALTLATGTGYVIGTTAAVTGTITNDDLPSITLAVVPTSVTEDGTTNLVYTFTRTGPTTSALTVNYGITGTADTTDYTGATPGTGKTITFAANSATATLTIDPTADTTIESNETIALTLATGTGYTVGTTTAVTGTITNDDLPSITLAVAPTSVTEDGTTNLVYTFTRTGPTTSTLTVNYGITGTADTTDYTGATPGTGKTITFAANSATATLTIDPTADTTIESNETVALTLATGTGYTIGTTTAVTGTITDDDTPSISLGLNYGGISENSPSNFIYTFTRTGPTTNALTVNYGITGTTDVTDYIGATPGTGKTIVFSAGAATATLALDSIGDTSVETDETISLQLAAGTGYTVGTSTAQIATIINDDGTRRQKGTNGKDVILGTNLGDILSGGLGNDTLTGSDGGDSFLFNATNEGIDTITDFSVGSDYLLIKGSAFGGGLVSGDTITSAQFIIGTAATNASQRFIYNSTSGALFFDVDGNGATSAIQFATLNPKLALTFEDIFVS